MKNLFDIFKNKRVRHLHANLKPGERIDRLFVDFILSTVEEKEFKYLKSKREFKRKTNFFEHHISWRGRKYNEGNRSVQFDIFINVSSPKYRKWETEFYNLEQNFGTGIDGTRVDYIEGWEKDYYEHGWYDLVKFDNVDLMEKINENIKNAGFNFYNHYQSLDLAITELKKFPIKNLEFIIDFYLIQDKWQDAYDFFESNKHWHEQQEKSEGSNPKSQYSMNRRKPFELRKEKLKNWAQQLSPNDAE
jgi:hypothetical protein